MEKAFDFKALEEKLKAQGMPMVENLAEGIVKAVFEWTEESLAIHPNMYVKFAIPVVASIKPLAFEQLDKIDGQVG